MNNTVRRTVTGVSCCVLLAAGGLLLGGGPLNPPVGAVAPTAKPLSEVEPRTAVSSANTPGDATSLYKITQPGSYYLTGNIQGVAGKHGIVITVAGVTLDLNGFQLTGVPGMGAFDAVSVTASNANGLSVINGVVRGWGNHGVNMGLSNQSRVENIVSSGNAAEGIHVFTGMVSRCIVSGNNIGLFASTGSTVQQCSAVNNAAYGMIVSSAGTLTDCSATFNNGVGFNVGPACAMRGCSARSNAGVGISAYASTCIDCIGSENNSTGIELLGACTASGCVANLNSGSGITADTNCSIVDCSSVENVLDGIRCALGCTVRGNSCTGNGSGGDGAGIHATGADNRIENNNCTGADRGVDVDAAGNLILRNSCSGNTTDWDLAAGNAWGVIIDRRSLATAGMSGFAAPATLGSSDPNANYSY